MPRDISPEEARDEKVAELTDKHFETLRRKLQGRDPVTVSAIAGAVAVELTDEVLNEIVVMTTHGTLWVGDQIKKLADKALLAQAEVEALREVEQLERQHTESKNENRIARAELARALDE
jgi:DNA-binding PadR family transcriptional regulator